MRKQRRCIIGVLGLLMCLAFTSGMSKNVWADSAREINTSVDVTLDRFYSKVKDGKKLVEDAKGILVFPSVYKAGFGIGGEYGEGALRIKGKTVD